MLSGWISFIGGFSSKGCHQEREEGAGQELCLLRRRELVWLVEWALFRRQVTHDFIDAQY